jgi:HlyD family secretion protein
MWRGQRKGRNEMLKRSRAFNFTLLGVLLLVLGLGAYFLLSQKQLDPKDKYLTAVVERGSLRRTVSSTGTIQAVVTVQVGSQVSGRIQELHADFNSVVKKGQTLAIIDPANFEAQRQRAQAGLATAEASVKNAEANLNNRKAELNSSKANLEWCVLPRKMQKYS